MTLDIVIATYNRASLLQRLLASLQTAPVPDGLDVRTIVVDNNSTDDTSRVVSGATGRWNGTLIYRFEAIQSKAVAVNNGLSIANADLVGLLDDDEEIDPGWFSTIGRMFRRPEVDFISGPYLPRWGAHPPAWLPPRYRAVIGWTEAGDKVLEFGKNFSGVMLGGNAVIRNRVGRAVGWYNPALGRVGFKAGSGCEDVDLFERLLAAGARGFYVPELIIHHYIPANRLTKRYHRRWCYNRSIAQAQADAIRPQPVAHVLGIPRYLIGAAIRSTLFLVKSIATLSWNTAAACSRELVLWEFAGYVRGALRCRFEGR